MILPPNLKVVSLAVTTSAVANTATSGALAAAPGSGAHYRLWAFWAAPTNTAQAVVNWRAAARDHTGPVDLIGLASANFAAPPIAWIPGGIPITGNSALDYAVQSALASLALLLVVYYTQESS